MDDLVSYLTGTMGSVAACNAVWRKADHAPPPSAGWSYTSTMLYMPSWCVCRDPYLSLS